MISRKTSLSIIAVATLIATSASATPTERQYTFIVPIQVAEVHDSITTLTIMCSLLANGQIKHGAQAKQMITLTNGGYSGNVTLTVTDNLRSAPSVDQWSCRMSGPLGTLSSTTDPSHPSFKEEYRLAPKSEFRDAVSGPIPK